MAGKNCAARRRIRVSRGAFRATIKTRRDGAKRRDAGKKPATVFLWKKAARQPAAR